MWEICLHEYSYIFGQKYVIMHLQQVQDFSHTPWWWKQVHDQQILHAGTPSLCLNN